METTQIQRRGAFATPWPYIATAFLSILTSPITFGFMLILGIAVGVIGALGGALSRSEQGRVRGVHALTAGLSFLAGPTAYLMLAVMVTLVD